MASIYSMSVDCIAFEPFDKWDDERGEYAQSGCVHFLPADGTGNGEDFLTLSREQVLERGIFRYVGPVTISLDWAEAEGGVVLAELSRNALRLVLDADAAESIEDDEIRVEFEVGDGEFVELREKLAELLAGGTELRVPGSAP